MTIPSGNPNICPHFGDCGGCQSQDLAYPGQLAAEEAMLAELFADVWKGPLPVTPSPVLWHYRNKVDPSFAPKRYENPPPKDFVRETVLGFKKRGQWFWPIDIEECRIGPEGLPDLLAAVRKWYREQGLRAFDSRSGEGYLRCLLVRDTKRTAQRMVVLITREGEFDKGPFIEAVRGAFSPHSIYHGVFHGLADVAAADELELLEGEPHITERLRLDTGGEPRNLDFRISPFSFFQTNPLATERLYGLIRQWVKDVGPRMLLDLYGGAGGIALSCADLAGHVCSVENVPSATADGRHNAEANGIANVEFVTEKVKNYLLEQLRGDGLPANCAAVADPPRSGMHPKALKRLLALAPTHLLYVSCNPKILARELPSLLEVYRLESLRAVDLFPHTRHVEVLAQLALREG